MSGEIDITPGYTFDEANNEIVNLTKLNQLVGDMIARLQAGGVTARELADGSITSDKLDVAIAAQLGIPDGSITTAKIVDYAVTADKLAVNAVETAKIKDLAVTAAKLAVDAVETAKIKDLAVTAAKLAANAVETAKIKDANVTLAKLASDVTMIPTAANAYAFSVYRNAAFTIQTSFAKISFDVESFDYGSAFAGGKFTAAVAGLYAFSACVASVSTDQYVQAAFYKNGAVCKKCSAGGSGGGYATIRASSGTILINLAVGEYIEVYAITSPSTTTGNPGAEDTYLTGRLVAKL